MVSTNALLGIGIAVVLAGSVGLCGCSPPKPPNELQQARRDYQLAATSPESVRAQSDVMDAKKALDRAEASFADSSDSDATKDWSYVASRKAASARAKASALTIIDQNKAAKNELQQARSQQMAELEKSRGELGTTKDALAREKQARTAADEKTRDALSKLSWLTSTSNDRGLVLTLSGSVLFAVGKSTLLPTAKTRLDEAMAAIKEDGRSIAIVGHTDSSGDEAMNQALSQRRAEAVKAYMASNGVPADRLKAEGAGESQPITDNTTPEGRANNRRVEIILEHARR